MLVQRFPGMELATIEPKWNGRLTLRGLDELPVSLGSSGAPAATAGNTCARKEVVRAMPAVTVDNPLFSPVSHGLTSHRT